MEEGLEEIKLITKPKRFTGSIPVSSTKFDGYVKSFLLTFSKKERASKALYDTVCDFRHFSGDDV